MTLRTGEYVYFIRDGLGHIKIGVTTNIKNRMDSLQTANPMKLEYFFGIHVETPDDAYALEKELHKKFSEVRLTGEWFEEKEVLKFLRQPKIYTNKYMFDGANW